MAIHWVLRAGALVLAGCVAPTMALDIAWLAPTAGASFSPGVGLLVRWKAAAELAGPLFRLCVANTGGNEAQSGMPSSTDACGEPITATVVQEGGAYGVTLATPNISHGASFFLQMEDTSGDASSSPLFTLSAAVVAPSTTAPVSNPASRASIRPSGSTMIDVNNDPLMLSRHSSVPVAAYAVPITVVSVIILIMGVVAVVQQRRLSRERKAATAFLLQATSNQRPGDEGKAEKTLLAEALHAIALHPAGGTQVSHGSGPKLQAIRRETRPPELPKLEFEYAPGELQYSWSPTYDGPPHYSTTPAGLLSKCPSYRSAPRPVPPGLLRSSTSRQSTRSTTRRPTRLPSLCSSLGRLSIPPSMYSVSEHATTPMPLYHGYPSPRDNVESVSASVIESYMAFEPCLPTLPMPAFTHPITLTSSSTLKGRGSRSNEETGVPGTRTDKPLPLWSGEDLYERVRQAVGS